MTQEELLQEGTFEELFKIENDIEFAKEANRLREIAKKEKVLKPFDDILRLRRKKFRNRKKELIFPQIDDDGRPKNLQINIWKLVEHYNITVRYNELRKEIDVKMNGSNDIAEDNKNEILEEAIYDKCIEHDFKGLSKDRLSAMLLTFADIGKFSPVKDYLDNLKRIEGTYWLDKLCETISATQEFDNDFKKVLIKTWLISCVAAAYSPYGISSHGVLVLQGKQGIGKTSWFRNLVPNQEWFKDGLTLDPKNKDSVVKVVKYWVCELGEIGSTLKKDFDALKAFLTQDRDELRRAFARKESFYPRRTIFCGSVNQDEFLTDDTGNRRFWTIPVLEIDYNHDVNREGLWGEICYMFESGQRHYLTREEQNLLEANNKNHDVKDYTDSLLESQFKWDSEDRYLLTSAEIFRELGSPQNVTTTKISRSLTKIGLKPKKDSKGNRRYEIPLAINSTEEIWTYKYRKIEQMEWK